jgi:ribosome-binding protein aMBF1 (putative translation factor)
MICDICSDEVNRLRILPSAVTEDTLSVCRQCLSKRGMVRDNSQIGMRTIINLHGVKTTKAEIDEVKRRVPLNIKTDGTYDLGRLMESGRVSENREPSYGDWG